MNIHANTVSVVSCVKIEQLYFLKKRKKTTIRTSPLACYTAASPFGTFGSQGILDLPW